MAKRPTVVAEKPAPIKIQPEQYWKLSALVARAGALRQDAVTAAKAAQDAQAAAEAYLAGTLGVPTNRNYTFDDEACALIPQG